MLACLRYSDLHVLLYVRCCQHKWISLTYKLDCYYLFNLLTTDAKHSCGIFLDTNSPNSIEAVHFLSTFSYFFCNLLSWKLLFYWQYHFVFLVFKYFLQFHSLSWCFKVASKKYINVLFCETFWSELVLLLKFLE